MEIFELINFLTKGGWVGVLAFMGWLVFRMEKKIDMFEKSMQEVKENAMHKEDYYRDMAELWHEVRDLRLDIKEMMKYLMEKKQ